MFFPVRNFLSSSFCWFGGRQCHCDARWIVSSPRRRASCTAGVMVSSSCLAEQWARVAQLDKESGEIERRIKLWHRSNAASQRIAEIPGVGVLTATAVVVAMGDPAALRSGREFAAWLGLVPRHTGTGGRVRTLGISKRGDKYLRTLLIHGARAVLTNAKTPPNGRCAYPRRKDQDGAGATAVA